MKISKLANGIKPSKGRQLFNLAAQYDDVINLTLGDPDIIPPECIRQAGCDAIMEGKTRYSANAGLVKKNLFQVLELYIWKKVRLPDTNSSYSRRNGSTIFGVAQFY